MERRRSGRARCGPIDMGIWPLLRKGAALPLPPHRVVQGACSVCPDNATACAVSLARRLMMGALASLFVERVATECVHARTNVCDRRCPFA